MIMTVTARRVASLAVLGALALVHTTSAAHFALEAPAAATEQDAQGSPQKAPPCGDDGTAVATGEVTTFQAGQTISITIDEKIFHPGHYRVALAETDPNQLPDPPPVTPANTPCGSTVIQDPPVYPVLADGMLLHTEAFSGPQTFEVTLPNDVTCTNCTLQVIQFMSNHGLNNPGGCYYHHCATIAIQEEPVMTTSSGATTSSGSGGGGGSSAGGNDGSGGTMNGGGSGPLLIDNVGADDGCGCGLVGSRDDDAPLLPLLALAGWGALFAVRRRRRR